MIGADSTTTLNILGGISGAQALTFAGGGTINLNNAPLGAVSSVTKIGSGTTTLAVNSASFTGNLTVNAGTFYVGGQQGGGTTSLGGLPGGGAGSIGNIGTITVTRGRHFDRGR